MEHLAIFMGLGVFVGLSGLSYLLKSKLNKFIEPGQVMIINTLGSDNLDVAYTNARIIPYRQSYSTMDVRVQNLVIRCADSKALECQDGLADLQATFSIRVGQSEADILRVATCIGVQGASDPEVLKRVFETKFSDALRIAAVGSTFSDIDHHREAFRAEVAEFVGKDLQGFYLEDVRIDSLVRQPSFVGDAQSRIRELEAKLRALGVAP